jgi:hypothetical protein
VRHSSARYMRVLPTVTQDSLSYIRTGRFILSAVITFLVLHHPNSKTMLLLICTLIVMMKHITICKIHKKWGNARRHSATSSDYGVSFVLFISSVMLVPVSLARSNYLFAAITLILIPECVTLFQSCSFSSGSSDTSLDLRIFLASPRIFCLPFAVVVYFSLPISVSSSMFIRASDSALFPYFYITVGGQSLEFISSTLFSCSFDPRLTV